MTRGSALLAAGWLISTSQAAIPPAYPIPTQFMSDQEWGQIVGPRSSEIYEIVEGDTLSKVSRRLFGDLKYWPKIWSINHDHITNPHLIFPGQKVAFNSGSGSQWPSLSMGKGDYRTEGLPDGEWKHLPRQTWEYFFRPKVAAGIDALGFDTQLIQPIQRTKSIQLPLLAATQPFEAMGEVIGSNRASDGMVLGDTVYIRAVDNLQVGEVYSVTESLGRKLTFEESDRQGLIYSHIGKIKIVSVRDEIFVGSVVESRDPIMRGMILVPRISKIEDLSMIPGPAGLEARTAVDARFSTSTSAQHKYIFLNVGTADGVRAGMLFRSFQYTDPVTFQPVIKADIIRQADVWIVHASERVSTALIVNSASTIENGESVTAVSNPEDIKEIKEYLNAVAESSHSNPAINALDKLDHAEGLGPDESRTLKQLELWRGEKPTEAVPPPPNEDQSLAPPTAPPTATPLAPPTAALDELDEIDAPPGSEPNSAPNPPQTDIQP